MVAVLSLYDQALAQFCSEVRKVRIKDGDAEGEQQLQDFLKQRATPQEAQGSIKSLSDHAGKKYGTKRIGDKVVISQKWMDNLLGNIDHAIAVGNKLMSGAPETVGMAWFCVKLGLNAIQSNYALYSLFGSGLTSMSELMILIPHFDKMHDQRHKPGFSIDEMTQKLFRDIVACYAAVLDFLFSIKRHVEASLLGKLRHGLKDFFGAEVKKFQDKQANIMSLKAKVLEASDARFQSQMFEGMDSVQESLKASLSSFESKAEELAQTQTDILQSLQDMRSSFKPKSRWDLLKQEYDANVKKLAPFQSDSDVFPQFSKKRYPGTLTWIYDNNQYNSWQSSSAGSLLCVSGQEGAGKSIAIATVWEKLVSEADSSTTICHFSCTNEDNNTEELGSAPADRIRHTLVYQLYSTLAVSEDDVNQLEEANKLFQRQKLSEKQQSVSATSADKYIPSFTDALPKMAAIAKRKVTFVVDGLDRLHDQDQSTLYDDFLEIAQEAAVTIKFLVGCRTSNQFASKASTKEQCLNLSASEDSAHDVGLILDSALQSIESFTDAERKEARNRVLERAGQSLAYVTTIAIPFLKQPFQRPLSKRLDALPETITDSFRQALNSMSPAYFDLLHTALTWTLYSAQQVRVKEVMDAFSGVYLGDVQMDVEEEYEEKAGHRATDLEVIQIQGAADRFLRIWADQVTVKGVSHGHHYVDLIDAARVRKFCDTTDQTEDEHHGHDHPLCQKCQPHQADQGLIALPEKEVHLRLALQLLKHLNNPLFQRRFGLVKPDGSPFLEEDTKSSEKSVSVDEKVIEDGVTAKDAIDGASAEESEESDGDLAKANSPPEPTQVESTDQVKTEGESKGDDADDNSSEASDEEEDEDADLGTLNNKTDGDGLSTDAVATINTLVALPYRYELEQWPHHVKQADKLFTAEEKANDPRWQELITELDKFAIDQEHVFRRWQTRYSHSDTTIWTYEQWLKSQVPKFGPLHAAARLGLTFWAKHLVEDRGYDPNQVQGDRSALRAIKAVAENLDTLEYFLSLPGTQPCTFSEIPNDPILPPLFHWLYWHGTVETIKLFQKYGADFTVSEPGTGHTALHQLSLSAKDPAAIRAMLEMTDRPDINVQGKNKNTALHMALSQSEVPEAVLDVLLEHGADVNIENAFSVRALELASWTAKSEIIEKILHQGVTEIDDPDDQGSTALHLAAAANSPACIKVLTTHGAKIDRADNRGVTPLHQAAHLGLKDAIETLVELGAKVDVKTKRNHTPFWNACNSSTSLEAATVLLESMKAQGLPVDVINCPSNSSRTPLRLAAMHGFTDIVKDLIRMTNEAGQDVPAMLDMMDEKGKATALHGAAIRGQVDCVRLLLEHGANASLSDGSDLTALQHASLKWQISGNPKFEEIVLTLSEKDIQGARSNQDLPATAAANGSIRVLKVLSRLGADINRTDSLGWSPLALAQKEHRLEVERFLKRHTANRTALPSAWVKHSGVDENLVLSDDGLRVVHQQSEAQVCLSTNKPLPANLDRFYFEITLKPNEDGKENVPPIFALGFCTLGASSFYFPGWPSKPSAPSGVSWAWHGDDGWLASPTSSLHGERFCAPDTIGCGVDLEEHKVWFTKNGERLEAEHTDVSGRLFPIIGIESQVSIETNFGTQPFVWQDLHEPAIDDADADLIDDCMRPDLAKTNTV